MHQKPQFFTRTITINDNVKCKKSKILMVDQTHTLALDYIAHKINSKGVLLNIFKILMSNV